MYSQMKSLKSMHCVKVCKKLLQKHFILSKLVLNLRPRQDHQYNGPNHLVQRTSYRISFRHPLDSTGCPVGFYTSSSGILQVCFKYLRIANFIEECNKNFNWTSTRIYWTSSRMLQDVLQNFASLLQMSQNYQFHQEMQ